MAKIGRNNPCSCGSGKKYKKCCGSPTLHVTLLRAEAVSNPGSAVYRIPVPLQAAHVCLQRLIAFRQLGRGPCLSDPGFEVDLFVNADLATMAKVWLGYLPFESALRSHAVWLTGPRVLVQAFPS